MLFNAGKCKAMYLGLLLLLLIDLSTDLSDAVTRTMQGHFTESLALYRVIGYNNTKADLLHGFSTTRISHR